MNTAIELLHPGTLAALLQEYFHYLRQAVPLYGGKISNYSGETAMVVFDQRANIDHAFNAICCAQLFQRLMQSVNDRHRLDNDQALEFRVAIHSGLVFHAPGDMSTDGGETGTFTGTYMGTTIDNAYHLCREGKPGGLTISSTACEEAGGRDFLNVSRSVEITFPADNMVSTACIVEEPIDDELLNKQCRHILQDQNDEAG